ncbi:MAG: ribosome-associated translation inhibitor RaiA [Deltaproteobacteria bacterium]|jgi:putative sigma-54 modulation protein|nr:ribosome-associated translation inhibitor RaiA [Deltaproteobacteria bacterium]
MQVSVTFRHMDATDALKSFAADKVSRIEKYMHSPTDAHVVLSVERGHMHRAEINLTANGLRIRGQEVSTDMYGSIDGATQKIERQLKKWKNKLASHKPREGHQMKVSHGVIAAQESAEVATDNRISVVQHQEVDARPMSVDEAIMQMELLHEEFHVFISAQNGAMNVLYRRADGGFGLIEPPGRH